MKRFCAEEGIEIAEATMIALEDKRIIVTGLSRHLENPITAVAGPS